ncbi:hypothetical protein [Haloarcula nitratireducens]|uniref:Uncharacterized protein n=1 Tax=Haloarcula nitratireducens TaxID=2487749 RepID=A0AAW4P9T1_9EURY|nr:hypothetical protein [Halomicroarcula nitratireducens]MBX0294343.1 hypothetical protein [Halomicroarcula nitratireducens]
MANRTNLLAGVCCLAGVVGLAVLFGPASLTAGLGAATFAGFLAAAGFLFFAAATGQTTAVGGREFDLHDCSGLGDIAVGCAIFGGLTGGPGGLAGVAYTALVGLGGLSAVLFGVVGLAEKYDGP